MNVDPGGKISRVARFDSGLSASLLSAAQASCDSFMSCVASVFGSKLGDDTMASTAPVLGFSATTAPLSRPSAWAAARCAFASSVVWTLAPFGLAPVARSISRLTNCESSRPDITEPWDASSSEAPNR